MRWNLANEFTIFFSLVLLASEDKMNIIRQSVSQGAINVFCEDKALVKLW